MSGRKNAKYNVMYERNSGKGATTVVLQVRKVYWFIDWRGFETNFVYIIKKCVNMVILNWPFPLYIYTLRGFIRYFTIHTAAWYTIFFFLYLPHRLLYHYIAFVILTNSQVLILHIKLS